METTDESRFLLFVFFVRFQQDGAKCRGQCQCIDSGQTDCNRHCQTELTIECTGSTSHETYRDKHGHHHQSNRYDGTAQLIHRIDGCQPGRFITLVELGVYTFDDHNGIIDHNGNGKHHGTKRKQVDTKPDDVEDEERTDQSYRDGDSWN